MEPTERNTQRGPDNATMDSVYSRPDYRNKEPIFGDHNAGLHKDLMSDWLSIMLRENRERMEQANSEEDTFQLFTNNKTVEYLFTICLRLRLPHEVMYLALGIYEKFMITHVTKLYETVKARQDLSPTEKIAKWEKIFTTISRQVALRAVSSIQIASKIHSNNLYMSSDNMVVCLQSLGYAYTRESVQKSELRILTSIKWGANMRQTPVVYLETFLGIIYNMNRHVQFDTKAIWDYALLVMDCIFLHSDEFYNRISTMVHGELAKLAPKHRINRLKADYVLLVSGVIVTAFICVHGSDLTCAVVTALHQLTNIPADYLTSFYTGIYQAIHEHNIQNPLKPWSFQSTFNVAASSSNSQMVLSKGF